MKLQTIHGAHIINHTMLGNELRHVLQQATIFNLVANFAEDWTHGACLILADALTVWSHGLLEPYACIRSDGVIDHITASNGLLHFNGHGLGTRQDVVDAFWHFEQKPITRIIPLGQMATPEILRDQPCSARIAARLNRPSFAQHSKRSLQQTLTAITRTLSEPNQTSPNTPTD